MKKIRFITFHYVSLLITIVYFLNFQSAFAQNLNWIKQVPGSASGYIRSMTTDGSGNLYVVGSFTGTIDFDNNGTVDATATGSDVWFAKYTGAGVLIGQKY